MRPFLGTVLCLLMMQVYAGNVPSTNTSPGVILEETDTQVVSLRYPSNLPDKAIEAAEKAFIEAQKQDFLKQVTEFSVPGTDLPGKNGLDIRYRIPYQTANVLSIRYAVSTFMRGSAHPNNSVVTHNYLDGTLTTLAALLKHDALPKLAHAARLQLQTRDLGDADWLKKGSAPFPKNYSRWYFTPEGLAIVFDTYQVAPYVFGPQTVKFNIAELSAWLKPGVARRVWGPHG